MWGKSPTATDDRFSNPNKPLYAGPDGWFNMGEVRASVKGSAGTTFQLTGSFTENSGDFNVVKDLQTLHFDFGGAGRPAPGEYKIGAKANMAGKMVKLSFADVGNSKIVEWSSEDGAGILTVKLVHGFTYFTCRNVTLQASGLSNKGDLAKPLTLGFEGALSPE